VNCSGTVNSVDALGINRHVAALSVTQTEPCPDIGSGGKNGSFGDVDCNGQINAVDALKDLRFAASLPVAQTQPCVLIGMAPANGT
jgi:hypothetical protein